MTSHVDCRKQIKTFRLKVKPNAHAWLNKAAVEVNQVWNWANETSTKARRPYFGPGKWLSGFDLNNLSAGATAEFERIGADTIQCVNVEYAAKRSQFKKLRLRWRVSRGSRRSLGWIPFKAATIRRTGIGVRFCGKSIRVFESHLLDNVKWKQGCFAQDAVGDWYLCLPYECQDSTPAPERMAVGIDLGLKNTATTSDGLTFPAGRYYRDEQPSLAALQRRGHKKQAKRLHRKIKRRRQDALHKFSRQLVNQYQHIVIGGVSLAFLGSGNSAKSQRDSSHGELKRQLQYKGEYAGRTVETVNEAYTTQACSECGALTGPAGSDGLVVRGWQCDCGAVHDRDVNAALNILALRSKRPFAGTSCAHQCVAA